MPILVQKKSFPVPHPYPKTHPFLKSFEPFLHQKGIGPETKATLIEPEIPSGFSKSTTPTSKFSVIMAEEQWNSNDLQYESLSEDEADKRENKNNNSGAITESSVKPEKEKGTKRKRSKAWDTFDFFEGANDEGHTVKCKKCSYTIGYNSSFGTGNILKHQKICVSSSDIRQMIISKSQRTMMVHNGAFDFKIFRDVITDVVKAVEDPNYVARSMAVKMQPKFDKYWSDYNMILATAVVFDPRYKTQFVEFCYKVLYGDDCGQISKLQETLKGLFDLYKNKIPTYTVVYESQPGNSLDNQGLDVTKEFDALDNDVNSAVEKTELDRYLEEKRLNRAIEIDVLDYWSTNQVHNYEDALLICM